MISQMIGFTAFVVLVLGGMCGTIFRYMFYGKAEANVSCRVNENLWKEAMEQSHLKETMDMSKENLPDSGKNAEEKHHHKRNGGMKISHAMV